jgi:hypothetical protein
MMVRISLPLAVLIEAQANLSQDANSPVVQREHLDEVLRAPALTA